MKLQLLIIFLLTVLVGCRDQKGKNYTFFVGTYTDGDSEGVYKYSIAKDGKLQNLGVAAVLENPSFLAKSTDDKFLLAVNEISNTDSVGAVASFKIMNDSLTPVNTSSSGGAHPCFVSVNDAGYVLTANYTGGNVGLLKLDSNGALSALLDVQQHSGKGMTDRQEGPHAHSAWFTSTNNTVISVDLGTNELWFSQLDTIQQKLIPADPNRLQMAPGAGPRHLTFHPNGKWIYVVNELNGTVTLVQKNANGIYEKGSSIATLPEGFKEPNTCADIRISSDGKFVYASNRGHNSIVIFAVNDHNGSLSLVAHEATRGDGPRNFSLTPDDNYLLVANQLTNNIISFKRDKTTGLLYYVDAIEASTPVCILF